MLVLVPSDLGQGPQCGTALRYPLAQGNQIPFSEPALPPQAPLGCDNKPSLPALPQRKSTVNT